MHLLEKGKRVLAIMGFTGILEIENRIFAGEVLYLCPGLLEEGLRFI